MFCPECGTKCEIVIDSYTTCYLCITCDQQWYYLNGAYYAESALEPCPNRDEVEV